MSDLELPGKLTVRAHGRQLILKKRSKEKSSHVLMKALLWALYLPRYPDLKVEVPIGLRYKPDLVALDPRQRPLFWAEAGQVGRDKVFTLCRRYRDTHLVFAKWDLRLDPWKELLAEACAAKERRAPVQLLNFPPDSYERFVQGKELNIALDDLEWVEFEGGRPG